jgi:hypothetical protein
MKAGASFPKCRGCFHFLVSPAPCRVNLIVVQVWLVSVLFSPSVRPAIVYEATDLQDITLGEDLWNYTSSVSGFDFSAQQGFSVFFGASSYKNLQELRPMLSLSRDVLAVQADVFLQDPGFFDRQALIDSASLATMFQVSFVWMGPRSPAAQPYVSYDSNFTPLFSGNTALLPVAYAALRWRKANC